MTMNLRFPLWSLPLLAACGAPGAPPAAPSAAAPAAAATPCPDGDALAETARAAWGQGAGTASASCLAVRHAGGTLWILDGLFEPDPDEGMVGMWTAVVRPGGEVVHLTGDDELPWGAAMRSSTTEWTAVDLDGDGDDEVLYVATYEHGGHMESSLQVAAIRGGELAGGESVPLGRDNSAALMDDDDGLDVCDARWELVDAGAGRRQVAVTYEGDDCESPGRHLFAWNGRDLVRMP
jgi:hypothetical protein